MNHWSGIGRLTRDPEIRYTNDTAVARYTLAVDRPYSKGEEKQADFISCVAFGKTAEFCEKHLTKGKKIAVEGRIQTGSYTNKDGNKVYTTDVIVDRHEFVESKNASYGESSSEETPARNEMSADEYDSIMNVETDEEMPFA